MSPRGSGLAGRVALVTGGSRGIGRGIVDALVEEGMRVAATARPSAALDELDALLRPHGAAIPGDVMDAGAVRRVLDEVGTRFGGLDVLINNVGGAPRFGGIDDLDDRDWVEAFELNVLSTVRFVRAALPLLRASLAPRIIIVSSTSGLEPGRFNPHYTTTKAALLNLSKYLSGMLADEGICVNVVCPGPVHSDGWERNIDRTAEVRALPRDAAWAAVEAEEAAKVPLGRVGEPQDVAGIVAFLASDAAAWISGACYVVDGGKRKGIA